MPMTNVNFRMDADLKRKMEKTCKDLGMNMTTAFTIFAKKVTNEQRIPFAVSKDPFYSETNQRILRESIEQVERGNYTVHDIIEVNEDD